MQNEELNKAWRHSFDYWRNTDGFEPIELVASADNSECYEMNCAHVFKMERGNYALVTESGCSCYDPSWASIDFFPTLEAVRDSLGNDGLDLDLKGKL